MIRRDWEKVPNRYRNDALLMGFALRQSRTWLSKRSRDIPAADRAFIVKSHKAQGWWWIDWPVWLRVIAVAVMVVAAALVWRYRDKIIDEILPVVFQLMARNPRWFAPPQ